MVYCFGLAASMCSQCGKRSSENLSSADIAVVLGNAVNRRGKPNPCLRSRVEAGVRLYRQGKVGELLMSGGTDGDGSNEAQTMRDMAVEMGVPSEKYGWKNIQKYI